MKRLKVIALILVSFLCLTTFSACKDKDVKDYDYSINVNHTYTTQNIFNESSTLTTDKSFVVIDLSISNLGKKSLPIWENDFSLKIGADSYKLINTAKEYYNNYFIKTDKINSKEESTYTLVFEIPLDKENVDKKLETNICDIPLSKDILTTKENLFTATLGEYEISTFEHKYYEEEINTNQVPTKPTYIVKTNIYTEIKIPISITNTGSRKLIVNRYDFKLSLNEEIDLFYKVSIPKYYDLSNMNVSQLINIANSVEYITPDKADSYIATIEQGQTLNYDIIFRIKNVEEEIELNYIELTLNDTKSVLIEFTA